MRLIADKAFRFAGRPLAVGDEFEANNRDGRVLVAVRRAHVDEGDEPESEKPASEAPANDATPKKKPAKKRAYKRRDMQAED